MRAAMLHWTTKVALGTVRDDPCHSSKPVFAASIAGTTTTNHRTKKIRHMSKVNGKFTIWMRRHLIACSIDLIERGVGLTEHHHSRLNSEAHRIIGCEVLFDCDSPMEMKASHHEQRIAKAWRFRRDKSIELAFKLKLLKVVHQAVSFHGNNFYTSFYEVTKFGKKFRKLPYSLQTSLIASSVAIGGVAEVATRFKWITGIASFGMLAAKVWHSGLISSWWIAASAATGLAAGFLATLWR